MLAADVVEEGRLKVGNKFIKYAVIPNFSFLAAKNVKLK